MGFWFDTDYKDYVKAHAGIEKAELLHPSGEPFDDKYPDISISYDSMPAWMGFSNLITLDTKDMRFKRQNEVHFKLVRFAYQTDREDYKKKVKSRLNQIKGRRTGSALLGEIAATGRTLRIVPYRGPGVNAETAPSVERDWSGATARGKPIDYQDKNGDIGTGAGANATIFFAPDLYTRSVMRRPAKGPDESLFHEMVHASRIMRGVFDRVPVDREYDDEEEYLAIALTNIYLSEKGQWSFRGNHHRPDRRLEGSDASHFLDNPQHASMPPVTLMKNFQTSQPDFYRALAHLPNPPRYNWVKQFDMRRDFYLNRQRGMFTM
jgi:hypothetical protein